MRTLPRALPTTDHRADRKPRNENQSSSLPELLRAVVRGENRTEFRAASRRAGRDRPFRDAESLADLPLAHPLPIHHPDDERELRGQRFEGASQIEREIRSHE